MSQKTSETDPLRIDHMRPHGNAAGLIGLTFCPGKKQKYSLSGVTWNRDLETDINKIIYWGGVKTAVLTLITNEEMSELKIEELPIKLAEKNIQWFHIPIEDANIPDENFEINWKRLSPLFRKMLKESYSILIHCKSGLGRTGTVASMLQIDCGADPNEAIRNVRQIRKGTIENFRQEKYVKTYKPESEAGFEFLEVKEKEDRDSIIQINSVGKTDIVEKINLSNFASRFIGGFDDRIKERKDRIRGCFLGGAFGDALGYPIEFLNLASIREEFGKSGRTSLGDWGGISDDTQMTLFTAEGIIRYQYRFAVKGLADANSCFYRAYSRWLHTQEHTYDKNKAGTSEKEVLSGSLFEMPELNHKRAPGTTCINALVNGSADSESKGCGSVMRVAPVGLLYIKDKVGNNDMLYSNASDISSITHDNTYSVDSCKLFSELISYLASGLDLEISIQLLVNSIISGSFDEGVVFLLMKAINLYKRNNPVEDLIKQLRDPNNKEPGEGWLAGEALAISVMCTLRAVNFEAVDYWDDNGKTTAFLKGVRIAVNHDGDSDSTGSLTGQLLGTLFGCNLLESNFSFSEDTDDSVSILKGLEARQLIKNTADDFFEVFHGSISDSGDYESLNFHYEPF